MQIVSKQQIPLNWSNWWRYGLHSELLCKEVLSVVAGSGGVVCNCFVDSGLISIASIVMYVLYCLKVASVPICVVIITCTGKT